uniref:TSA: Wollemia nobilis Ref_Wollemi_Transcript_19201_1080 transcribed RNA sequence n=1 Tax=Wollemia nobilis TaxID=56998 RepID=A0A0C9RRH4_9CONI
MAAAQMLSLASAPHSSSFSLHLQQSHTQIGSVSALCGRKLQQKLDGSNFSLTISVFKLTKPRYVCLRPRRWQQPVLMTLPTTNPERASAENRTKWSEKAIKSFSLARVEARKMRYPITGTEALVLGILIEGTSPAAKFLWANGVTIFKVREEIIKLLGRGEPWVQRPEEPPLTKTAQKALDWAVDEKNKSGESGEVTTTHLLLGIWAQKGSTGQVVLANLGFDEKKAEEVAKYIKEDVVLSSK